MHGRNARQEPPGEIYFPCLCILYPSAPRSEGKGRMRGRRPPVPIHPRHSGAVQAAGAQPSQITASGPVQTYQQPMKK